jgi:hypothetical protein
MPASRAFCANDFFITVFLVKMFHTWRMRPAATYPILKNP